MKPKSSERGGVLLITSATTTTSTAHDVELKEKKTPQIDQHYWRNAALNDTNACPSKQKSGSLISTVIAQTFDNSTSYNQDPLSAYYTRAKDYVFNEKQIPAVTSSDVPQTGLVPETGSTPGALIISYFDIWNC